MESTQELTSIWQGSQMTAAMIRQEITDRWGEKAAKKYDPKNNCFTFNGWKQRGYMVKHGEHGMKSITFILREQETTDEKTGKIETKTFKMPKAVTLFYQTQVSKI